MTGMAIAAASMLAAAAVIELARRYARAVTQARANARRRLATTPLNVRDETAAMNPRNAGGWWRRPSWRELWKEL
ncbi:hypothetical protein [Candidatus Poriferisocius sp.]|uniref:hypothetical protein n=1 Tax=Candidatus Poriferisocius sp. TaxID=3101276 RepID=UPI003B023DCE